MSANIEMRIRDAYKSLASKPGAWIRLTDVYRALADVPSTTLNEALRRLGYELDVEMMPESNQKTLTAEDRRKAVRYGGQDAHLIAIDARWK